MPIFCRRQTRRPAAPRTGPLLLVMVLVAGAARCSGENLDACPTGSVGCACRADGSCGAGLECAGVTCTWPSVCGDGVVGAGESCDDGADNGRGNGYCAAGCLARQLCGDGFAVGNEACDGDGTGTPGETATCDEDCTAAQCGDGMINATAGERCDDGDGDNSDDCPDGLGGTCQPATCGDGFADGEGAATEACDGDGAGTPGETGTCNADCTAALCGDGVKNAAAFEACDDGNENDNDDCPDGVFGTCAIASCSDGILHDQGTGTETAVDCGGTCGGCEAGLACTGGADCLSGLCLSNACADIAVTGTTPAAVDILVPRESGITVVFNASMNPSTLTAQTSDGACSGSILLSADGFATCIGFSSATPLMSAGDTVAILQPLDLLLWDTTYQVRVATLAQSAGGVSLASSYTSTPGFVIEPVEPVCDVRLVVSQVYGGGGNAGAVYTNDFVELHNRTAYSVDLTGWSVQYASAASSSWQVTPLEGTVPPRGYFLVQQKAGQGGSMPLPTPDAVDTKAMAADSGKVLLATTTTAMSVSCPAGPEVVDLVGYGTANCYEGSAAIGSLSNTKSARRLDLGCTDGDENAADFELAAVAPRNSATAGQGCVCSEPGRAINETDLVSEADICAVSVLSDVEVAAGTQTPMIYGRILEIGVTDTSGATRPAAELGYGPAGSNPQVDRSWIYVSASYNAQVGDSDEYAATITSPTTPGTYWYTFRFSFDGGGEWTYCDTDGAGSDVGYEFSVMALGSLVVTP